MLAYMKPFETNRNPSVLLMGNGIHRTFGRESWGDLLKNMAPEMSQEEWDQIKDLPYPLKAVVAAGDSLGGSMKEQGRIMTEQQVQDKETEILKKIPLSRYDAVLTANYTYELEQALFPEFSCRFGCANRFRHKTCAEKPAYETSALYQYMGLPLNDGMLPVWHIHGEAARADSMVIGHYYYGKLLAAMQRYAGESIARYRTAEKQGREFYPRSWEDYFLYGNITIIGLGLHFSEMDLWWLINCKKRNGTGKIIWYEPNLKPELRMLAEAYRMDIRTQNVEKDGYAEYYSSVIDRLAEYGE